ncbi:hypothetical protein GCM10010276_03220 [Streptomyces longisporus]|uniref:Rhamnogalacturonan lyase family 11 C-terminal domain-containing protein n=1 Tax=Streptomyces longisporus TaxID=1948 RepID=A0ABP5Y2T7_STRLO
MPLGFVLTRQPTNAKDNSWSGRTGDTFIDGIKPDGTRPRRIDLGRNIGSGAHYTQFSKAMATVDHVPARGTVSSWGDSYGNRVDRFLAGTAYLDGSRPSLVMARRAWG